jgi:succinate dehydrogenase / fumarate reductase, cytochrome b subunit
MPESKRPLSPHLQVYRLPMAALLSISHRMAGLCLSAGIFVLVFWLWAAMFSPDLFGFLKSLFASFLGQIALFGWTLAFFYHLCAGIRHLVWDTGFGYAKPTYALTNWIVLGAAVLFTSIAWIASGAVQ